MGKKGPWPSGSLVSNFLMVFRDDIQHLVSSLFDFLSNCWSYNPRNQDSCKDGALYLLLLLKIGYFHAFAIMIEDWRYRGSLENKYVQYNIRSATPH